MDPIKMAYERQVGRDRAQRDLCRKLPVRSARLARAQLTVDLDSFQLSRRLVDAKERPHSTRAQPVMVLVTRESAEVPLIATFGRSLDVARVGSGNREGTKIHRALILFRHYGCRKAAAMGSRGGFGQGLLWIRIYARQSGLHRSKRAIHRHLELIEIILECRSLVGGNMIGDPDIRNRNAGKLARKTNRIDAPAFVAGHGDHCRPVRTEFADRDLIPEAFSNWPEIHYGFSLLNAASGSAPFRAFHSNE